MPRDQICNPLLFFLMGCIAALVSYFYVYQPDSVWKLKEEWDKSKGLKSERTPEWDRKTRVEGHVGFVASAFLFLLAFYAMVTALGL